MFTKIALRCVYLKACSINILQDDVHVPLIVAFVSGQAVSM